MIIRDWIGKNYRNYIFTLLLIILLSLSNVSNISIQSDSHHNPNDLRTSTISSSHSSNQFTINTNPDLSSSQQSTSQNPVSNHQSDDSKKEHETDDTGTSFITLQSVSLENSPGNTTISESEVDYELSWTASDSGLLSFPDNYTIELNDKVNQTDNWNSNDPIYYQVANLPKGIYKINVTFYDIDENSATDTIYLTVEDNKNPNFDSTPTLSQVNEGSTGNYLEWTVSDNYPSTYQLYRNGSLINESTWVSGTPIRENIDILSKATYNFTILVYDESWNNNTDQIFVDVLDNSIPIFSTLPDNSTYEMGSTGNTFTWVVTEKHPDIYKIYQNDIQVQSAQYLNETGIVIDIDGNPVGTYNYTIEVNDTSGNINRHTVFAFVVDTTSPSIDNPSDITYEMGSTSNEIIWSVSDLNPKNYTIERDGIQIQSSTWNSGSLSTNIDGHSLGTYNYVLTVFDDYGNQNSDVVSVTVIDTTAPQITSPMNVTYDLGSSGNFLSWSASDINPRNYTLYRNQSFAGSGIWDNSNNIIEGIDGLDLGVYVFRIYVSDVSNNTAIDTVYVTVVDITKPVVVDYQQSYNYSIGTTGNLLYFTVSDLKPNNYEFYSGSTSYDNGTWESDIEFTINIDGFSIGQYNLSLIAFDTSQNNVTVYISLKVTDRPVILDTPPNFFNQTDPQTILQWHVADLNPDYYQVYHNGSLIQEGTWTTDFLLNVSIYPISLGYHNFTVYFNDTDGFFDQSTSIILITDIPVIDTYANDVPNLPEKEIFYYLNISAYDDAPDSYVVLVNGTIEDSGLWNSYEMLNLSISDLNFGYYEVEFVFYDVHGNSVTQLVNVNVTDITAPNIQKMDDFSHEVGTNGVIYFNLTDANPYQYQIYLNGSLNQTATWTGLLDLEIDLSYFGSGSVNFTLLAIDKGGNRVAGSTIVQFIDTTNPTLNYIIPTDIYEGEDIRMSFNISDFEPGDYQIYVNDSLTAGGSWTNSNPTLLFFGNASYGVYKIEVFFYDNSSNVIHDLFYIDILDGTLPIIQNTPDQSPFIFEEYSPNNLIWQVSDNNTYQYEFLVNGSLYFTNVWSTNTISFDISTFEKGIYNISIILYDKALNRNSDNLIITILDTSSPVIQNNPDDLQIALINSSVSLDWIYFDNHPYSYQIFVNDSLFIEGTWQELISLKPTSIGTGTYDIRVVVYDEDGNSAFDTVSVVIHILDTSVSEISPNTIVHEGDIDLIFATWNSTIGGIENGNIRVNIRGLDNSLRYSDNLFSNSNGEFTLKLNYTGFESGQYIVEWVFTKYGHRNITNSLVIEVIPHEFTVDISFDDELIQNEEYIITVILYYKLQGNQTDGLGLNSLIQNSGPAAGYEVELILEVEKLSGGSSTIAKTGITNSQGVITFVLNPFETDSIKTISSFGIEVPDSKTNEGTTETIDSEKFPEIIIAKDNYLPYFVSEVTENIKQIIFISVPLLILLALSIWLLLRRRRKLLAKQRKYKAAYDEIMAYNSTRVIFLQSKDGIPYFQLNLVKLGVDTSLIGGMSSAISSFLSEIDQNEATGFEVIEREGLSIISHKTDLSSFVVIADYNYSELMMDKMVAAHNILEENYHTRLEIGSGEALNENDVLPLFIESGYYIPLTSKLTLNSEMIDQTKEKLNDEIYEIRMLPELFSNSLNSRRGIPTKEIIQFFVERGVTKEKSAYLIRRAFDLGFLIAIQESLEGANRRDLLESNTEVEYNVSDIAEPDDGEDISDYLVSSEDLFEYDE